MLDAVMFGHEQMQVAIKAISELVAEAGKPGWEWAAPETPAELVSAVAAQAEAGFKEAYQIREKQERYTRDW